MNTITSDSPLFQRGEGKSPEPYVVDESRTVTRFFPKPVNLTLPGHTVRKFPAGIQEVPEELANHDWLKANGMVEYQGRGQPLPIQPQAPLGSQGFATAVAQSGVYDATTIPNYVLTDDDIKSADAMARMAAENVKIAQDNLNNALRIHQNSVAALNDAQSRRAATVSDSRTEEDGAVDESKEVGLSDEDKMIYEGMTRRERKAFDEATPEERVALLNSKRS